MNLKRRHLTALLALALLAAPAAALFIDVEFFGGADIAGYRSWSWSREGNPAANVQVEGAVRAEVERQMRGRGYERVAGDADCYIEINVEKDRFVDSGIFSVDVLAGATREVVWRGKAEGSIGTQIVNKQQKIASRAVKKMFKQFPKRRK